MLDLECRVRQLEPFAQEHLELAPDRVAVRSGLDEDVRREGRKPGRDRPEVEVVHADHAIRRGDRGADLPRVHSLGRPFQQHADGLAQHAGRARDDEQADQDRHDRVGVGPAGREHDEPRNDDARRRREVRQNVQHRRADVQAGAGAVEHARRDEVHDEPGDAGGEHPAAHDAGRIRQAADPRPDDPRAEDDEHERVDQGGQHLGAPPAEAPLRRRRAVREPGGEEGETERKRVREHVRRVGEKRQRVGGEAGERLDSGEAEHEPRTSASARRAPSSCWWFARAMWLTVAKGPHRAPAL